MLDKHHIRSGITRNPAFSGSFPVRPMSVSATEEMLADNAQKQAALSYLSEAWAEARLEGIDGDCLAQASLFTAFAELVTTYGEDAVAKFVEGLSTRIKHGEFSISMARQ